MDELRRFCVRVLGDGPAADEAEQEARQSAGSRTHDSQVGNHGANFCVRTQQTAEADAQDLGVLVIPHRQRHLQVLGGMEPVRIFEVPFPQSARFAKDPGDILLAG